MSFLIPEKEIKQTLANADETLVRVRNTLAEVNTRVIPRVILILDDLGAITSALKAIFVKSK